MPISEKDYAAMMSPGVIPKFGFQLLRYLYRNRGASRSAGISRYANNRAYALPTHDDHDGHQATSFNSHNPLISLIRVCQTFGLCMTG